MPKYVHVVLIGVFALWATLLHAADRPDHRSTPGVADPQLTKQVLCARGFTTKKVRNVANETALKASVYSRYHMVNHKGTCALVKRGCEVDHLIPLEVGGKTDIRNLWPQSYGTKPWNAGVKDRLENALHKQICAGTVTLKQAQKEIATDWIASYQKRCVKGACPAWRPPK
jgi:hypothetical protein